METHIEMINKCFEKVEYLVTKGVLYTMLVLGGMVVIFAIVANIIGWLPQTEFIVTILVGTFLIILSAGICVYKFKLQQEFIVNTLKQLQNTNTDTITNILTIQKDFNEVIRGVIKESNPSKGNVTL